MSSETVPTGTHSVEATDAGRDITRFADHRTGTTKEQP
ncbi:hypothetical protein HEMA109418_01290 [Helcobacillus massiliensis]|uniref:Uncharacterized protein n=1 Tax=Helcobacillus massiliensis TaxID=521392 RepID=A0A839QTW7_9MICO|nr:hypothetical protein [Helcobacillus massiliensis]